MDQLAHTALGQTQAFKEQYAAFQDGMAAYDAYDINSNQTVLGQYLTRYASGAYLKNVVTDDQKMSGYRGYLYHDSVGDRYIFANAGTKDAWDGLTDYTLGGNQLVPQLTVAQNNAQQLSINGVPNLTFTGHSLGGALAILQGLTVGDPVVTFNSAPFTATMARLYGVSLASANRLITNYRVANDPLSEAEDHHVWVTGAALVLKGIPFISPFIDPANAWRLSPPPGKIITLPVGVSGPAAHKMANVLGLLSR
jgi:hypothetical protein